MKAELPLLTADELAERLRVKPGTVRSWSRLGLIPTVRLSSKVIRFELAAVVAALTARGERRADND